MKILALCKAGSGVDYHRLTLPLSYMEKSKDDLFMIAYQDHFVNEESFKNVDIVLYSRECPLHFNTVMSFKQKYKFKLVVDLDDYWTLDSTHPLYEKYERENIKDQVIKSLIAADLITVSVVPLIEKVMPYNRNVKILPNALPYGEEQFNSEKTFSSGTKDIVYACSPTHYFDLKQIGPFFGLCRGNFEIQKNFKLILAGVNRSTEESRSYWSRLERLASSFGNYDIKFNLRVEYYMNHYNSASLSIAPLAKTRFNLFKSNLKILEAGCKKIPILVSNYGPYSIDGCDGLNQCNNNNDWYKCLRDYAKNPNKLQDHGEILHEYVVKNYNLFEVNKRRYELYKNLINT